MKVFRVEFDVSAYQSLVVDLDDQGTSDWRRANKVDGTPMAAEWTAPPLYVENPLLARADFWYLWGAAGIVAPPHLSEGARSYLEAVGEMLPLPFDGEPFEFCNVTMVVNCLDSARTKRRASGVIEQYEFVPHRFAEVALFKLPETAGFETLCCEFEGDPTHEFKAMTDVHGLRGLRFALLWEGG